MLQLPVATLALQLWVPSPTVTVPVGVPLPGALADTVKLKLTAWPTADGLGVWPVIAVVVPAAFTVCPTPAEALPAKFASPPYVAVSVLLPGAVGTTVKVKLTACPTADGSGVWPVIVVVVPAAFTVWDAPADVLPAKFASPA